LRWGVSFRTPLQANAQMGKNWLNLGQV
jgi:hypothetical protein